MTHEELLKKYNVNATEFNEQKEEIANIFLKELANMQQAEAEGLGFESYDMIYMSQDREFSPRPV